MGNIIIIGSGGHAKHLKSIITDFNNSFVFDGFLESKNNLKTKYNDKNVKNKIKNKNVHFVNGLGNFAYYWYPNVFKNYTNKKLKFIKLTHKTSIISKISKIGYGTTIMENALIKSNSKIGQFCLVNSQSTISHNVTVGNYCNISLGARIGGNCSIGNNTFIGMNAVIKQGLKIGSNSIIGAGSVVIKNIPNNVVVAGNPTIMIKKNL